MTVTAPVQENGFKNVKYTAEEFDIIAADYTTVYKLYYKAEGNDNWIEIPSYKNVDDDYEVVQESLIFNRN